MKKRLLLNIVFLLFINPFINSQNQISLDAIFKEHLFFPKKVEGLRSMQNGESYTVLNQFFYIDKYNYDQGEYVETLFSVKELENPPFSFFDDYEFSKDETKLLLSTSTVPIYRHSYKATYFIYDLITKRLQPLSDSGPQQISSFSPDGTMVAFMRGNNLFIKDIQSKTERQITFDGEWNRIINGAPDWVYEEEFGFTKAYDWSPDSKKIAFCKFDESRVKQFNMTLYEGLYPQWYQYKYPKAGEDNSIVTVHVFDIATGDIKKMNTGEETNQYIPRIKWTQNPEILSIIRLNRMQNIMDVLHADVATGTSSVIFEEINDYYISEINDNTISYLKSNHDFLLVSERSGWKHIYRYDYEAKEIMQITKGEFDIGEILSIDETNRLIYYTSHEESPISQQIYKINFDGSKKKKITSRDGWNDAQFSNNGSYFILNHSNANRPSVFSIHNSDGRLLKTLEGNTELAKIRKEYRFLKKEFFNFKTSYGEKLNGYMIKPSGFDKKNKYPVFMVVYGGPESQYVTNRFAPNDNWFQMLAQKGYLVVCVDNRGTDNRGEKFRKATYLQLGKLETEDQLEAAVYLKSLPYVESSRIGIYGWSYGGYMSLLCLAKGADIFKMAISVAPVTNWRFYDTIYTERFMRTPQENPEGYDDNSPINHVEKIKGKLLLIHGMADDNVHLQNSTELVDKLVEADKKFEMIFYPNKNHGIHGGNTSYHLYRSMTDFVLENL